MSKIQDTCLVLQEPRDLECLGRAGVSHSMRVQALRIVISRFVSKERGKVPQLTEGGQGKQDLEDAGSTDRLQGPPGREDGEWKGHESGTRPSFSSPDTTAVIEEGGKKGTPE